MTYGSSLSFTMITSLTNQIVQIVGLVELQSVIVLQSVVGEAPTDKFRRVAAEIRLDANGLRDLKVHTGDLPADGLEHAVRLVAETPAVLLRYFRAFGVELLVEGVNYLEGVGDVRVI